MRFDVLTLFPEMFQGYLTQSLLKLAIEQGLVEIHLWNIRDWAQGKHKSVDDRPFGGGPGMVLMPGPVYDCVEAVRAQAAEPRIAGSADAGRRTADARRWCGSWPIYAGCCSCAAGTKALTSASGWGCGPVKSPSATSSATAARCRPWW